ncbi:hypothetical protein DIPPA_20473 [Diplonema papillatum]|nr:hypothetical protein DIPPA_20473 [Diplonema papillatum]
MTSVNDVVTFSAVAASVISFAEMEWSASERCRKTGLVSRASPVVDVRRSAMVFAVATAVCVVLVVLALSIPDSSELLSFSPDTVLAMVASAAFFLPVYLFLLSDYEAILPKATPVVLSGWMFLSVLVYGFLFLLSDAMLALGATEKAAAVVDFWNPVYPVFASAASVLAHCFMVTLSRQMGPPSFVIKDVRSHQKSSLSSDAKIAFPPRYHFHGSVRWGRLSPGYITSKLLCSCVSVVSATGLSLLLAVAPLFGSQRNLTIAFVVTACAFGVDGIIDSTWGQAKAQGYVQDYLMLFRLLLPLAGLWSVSSDTPLAICSTVCIAAITVFAYKDDWYDACGESVDGVSAGEATPLYTPSCAASEAQQTAIDFEPADPPDFAAA